MDLSRFSLEGKVALVTGGSRGIGRATALAFAQAGANVAVTSRKLPDLEQVAAEIRGLGRRSLAVAAHVGRMDQLQGIIDSVVKEFGTLDILVNNAGVSPLMTPAIDLEERAWDVIMNLNLKGLFFLSQAAARVMKAHGGGSIINVSSADAYKPEFHVGAYSISKAAIVMVSKVFALELAPWKIRVNTVAPGAIRTRTLEAKFAEVPGMEEQVSKNRPLGRIGEPDDVAGIMLYLASDASSYATGQTFVVDGGELLK